MRAMLWPSCWECFLCSSPAVNFALGQEHTSSLMAETNQEAERLTAGPTVMPPALPSRPSRGRPPRAPQRRSPPACGGACPAPAPGALHRTKRRGGTETVRAERHGSDRYDRSERII
jgi:hypothetical protein